MSKSKKQQHEQNAGKAEKKEDIQHADQDGDSHIIEPLPNSPEEQGRNSHHDGKEPYIPPLFNQGLPPTFPHPQDAIAMAQYYEARMRDHAVAYASAAAGAAWAAAHIAASTHLPPSLPPMFHPPPPHYVSHHAPTPPHFEFYHSSTTVENPGPSAEQHKKKRRQREYSSSSDTAASRYYQRNKYSRRYPKKRRENLVGKTGVSALHEWCVKRKKTAPNFVLQPGFEDFCFAAYVDDVEWGRGHGVTKGAAKQEAARKALEALLPAVVFDANGLVVSTETIDDDLLPNLAQKLAIDTNNSKIMKKRRCDNNPDPSTATSSEDEFYANRGFSVCSALLHAMWQISDNIPKPPSYSFEVATEINSRPSSFACTGTLNLKVESTDKSKELEGTDERSHKFDETVTSSSEANRSETETLTALATGANKREARHAASAKLLAMLFPQCDDISEVIAAAEAAREAYAAAKRTMRKPSDPNLPIELIDMIQNLNEEVRSKRIYQNKRMEFEEVSVECLSLSDGKSDSTSAKRIPNNLSIFDKSRSSSRRKQLQEMVDNALQNLNEFDVEGRSLHDPNFHDVGRTVLRLVEAEDAGSVYKLLCAGHENQPTTSKLSPLFDMFTNSQDFFWGSNSIPLLLCRAIAPFDEPPLGCAILTLSFSMEQGRVLRIAEIGIEPHLPQERFVECLQQFAASMKCYLCCKLLVKSPSGQENANRSSLLTSSQLTKIVDSYLGIKEFNNKDDLSRMTLCSVIEEEDGVKPKKTKTRDESSRSLSSVKEEKDGVKAKKTKTRDESSRIILCSVKEEEDGVKTKKTKTR